MQHIEGEIIVVDNASVDGTAQQVRQHFPDVHLIANQDNRGFATANNQGIVAAKENLYYCSTLIPLFPKIPFQAAYNSWNNTWMQAQ